MRNFASNLALVLMLLVVGCEEPTGALGPESYLRAAITDETAAPMNHDAAASFTVGGSISSPGLRGLMIGSHSERLDTEIVIEGLGYDVPNYELLPIGTHELRPLDRVHGDGSTGHTFWFVHEGAIYVSESGTVTITRSADHYKAGVIEGSFEGTAVYWLTSSEGHRPLPETFPADAPRIDVEGTFRALPAADPPVLGG